jgi:hypothetical protein
MEILTQLQDPAIIAATMVIVGLIKDKGFLAKIPTKLVSLAVSLVLFGLSSLLEPSVEWVLNVEKILVVILPAVGYDYIYKPILKPIFDVLSKRNPTN